MRINVIEIEASSEELKASRTLADCLTAAIHAAFYGTGRNNDEVETEDANE